ncbi:MAG: LapA family protein [Deltaproteobacteria bacterium]|nr:LapA family protein [Deltaproteobacteria bacterium]
MSILRAIFFLILAVAAIGFAIYNDEAVALKYYFGWGSIPLPLFLWVFLCFLAGLILSSLVAVLSKLGLHSGIRQKKKLLTELEHKRNTLRMGP